jgi:tRNA-specific adenosine deaminase 3
MFNHSPTPNVNFIRSIPTSRNPETQPSLIFKTFRPIKAGEELFICYAADDSRLWFSPDYVQPKSTSKDEPYANADAGPSSRSPQRAMTVEDELPPFPQAIDSLSDSEAPSKAARRDRRKREREEKRRKWQEKNAEKEKRRVADAAAVGGGANGDLALVNGSSETGVDRTPGDGTPNEISEEAYQAALEALDMVEQVDITHEQVAIEDADQEDSFYPGWSKAPRIKGRIETEQDDDSRTSER